VLWIIQGLLAILFLFKGGMKLVLPIEAMTKDMPPPGLFLRFIGVAEVLGAIGLILLGLLRIRPGLTTIGATVLTLKSSGATLVLIPWWWGSSRRSSPTAAGGRGRDRETEG
jgi:hypothetical protein